MDEAKACVRAIAFARDLRFRSIELERDSSLLITKLQALEIDRLVINPLIWKVKRMVLDFERFKYQHIKRGGNTVAHLLAREGSLRHGDIYWVEEGPSSITTAVV